MVNGQIIDVAKNLAVDVPKIWIESRLPMDELFWEISKPLLPLLNPNLLSWGHVDRGWSLVASLLAKRPDC